MPDKLRFILFLKGILKYNNLGRKYMCVDFVVGVVVFICLVLVDCLFKFYFEVISYLHKSCQNSTKNSYKLWTWIYQFLTFCCILNYRHTSFYCALFYCSSQISCFSQIEEKILQQKDYNSLYCDTCFIWWLGTKPVISLRSQLKAYDVCILLVMLILISHLWYWPVSPLYSYNFSFCN